MRPLAILFLTGCSIDSKIGNSISCGEGTELIDSECVPISEPDGPDDTGITEDTGTDIIEDADGDGWTEDEGDCDDDNDAVHPEAIEMCDEIDNDCDDEIDERDSEDARFFFRDNDGDTWGVDDDKIRACTPPEGYVDRAGDCDDTDPTIHPEAEEEWYDGIDSDCGEDSDFDADGDGHDTVDSGGDDCDDTDALVSPTADEVCDDDDIDEDCDGLSDDDDDSTLPESMTTWYLDLDGDGLGDMDDPGFAQCEEPFLVTEAVIDFEDMSSGAPTTEYSHLGATFTGSAHGVCAGLS